MKLKKGDKVIVIAGKAKGESAAIVRVFPADNMVVLDGVNMSKRHRKPSAQNRQGQIVERATRMHASNVMLVDPKTGKPTRIKISRDDKGARTRVAVKSGETI